MIPKHIIVALAVGLALTVAMATSVEEIIDDMFRDSDAEHTVLAVWSYVMAVVATVAGFWWLHTEK